MNGKWVDYFTHPVTGRLLLEIHTRGSVTAKQLAEVHGDIAQTTLYRHLNRMTDDGIIKVVKETPIRGTVEKTYAFAADFGASIQSALENNSGEAFIGLFMQYISGFVKSFQEYCKRDDINIKADISTFTTAPIYVTNEELITAMQEIGEIVTGLVANEPSPERKLRSLGFIVTPPQNRKGKSV